MTKLTDDISDIKKAAELEGLPKFARLAGVPYTTVHSFAKRGWSHKNLETFEKLATAARKVVNASDEEAS